MGSGLSGNYENITPIFNLAYWKVHSATHKETHQPVSLWLLDNDKIKADGSSRAERNTYIESCLYSIKTLQQLDHPNILKIQEANENLKELGFVAEPVLFSMSKDLKYSNDECFYFADQIASIANYLTYEKKFVSFEYNPESFVFSSNFSVKLCMFNYTSLIINAQNHTVPRYPWKNNSFSPPLNYTAPEYSNNQLTTAAADVFSFGSLITSLFLGHHFFNYQDEKDFQSAISTGKYDIPESIPTDIGPLLQCCFDVDPSRRLTFSEISHFPVFMSKVVKILRSIDMIMTNSQSERFTFYTTIKDSLNLFSQRMLEKKILPLVISEILSDPRFGTAVLPIIYSISDKMDNNTFLETVFRPLAKLMLKMDPPDFGMAVLDGIRVVISHIERNELYDVVYPIFIAAFGCRTTMIQVSAAKNMAYLIQMIPEHLLTYKVLPKINEVVMTAIDPKVIGYLMRAYEEIIEKIDQDHFVETIIPTLSNLWRKIKSPYLAKPIASIFTKLNASLNKRIQYMIPLVCQIMLNEEVDPEIQDYFLSFSQDQFNELRKERKIDHNSNTKIDSALFSSSSSSLKMYSKSQMPNFAIPLNEPNRHASMPLDDQYNNQFLTQFENQLNQGNQARKTSVPELDQQNRTDSKASFDDFDNLFGPSIFNSEPQLQPSNSNQQMPNASTSPDFFSNENSSQTKQSTDDKIELDFLDQLNQTNNPPNPQTTEIPDSSAFPFI